VKKLVTILLIALLLLGCNSHKNNDDYKNILGEWNIFQYKLGGHSQGVTYFKFYQDKTVDIGGPTILTKNFYRIKEDSLMIYNIGENKPTGIKIEKLTKDSLILNNGEARSKIFTKVNYNSDNMSGIDKIVLSSSGCFGSCPSLNIIVNSDGSVVFSGVGYTSKIGFYTARISNITFDSLRNNFIRANVKNIDDYYLAEHTDDESITTTFLKNDKIVKSITDYGHYGPIELELAYPPLRYLYRSIQMDKIPGDELPKFLKFHYSTFQLGNKALWLSQSERFLLWDYLRKGIKSKKAFRQIYLLDEPFKNYSNNEILQKVETDGQYYKFYIKDEQPITIDIGFNFIDTNFKPSDFKESKD